MAVYQLPLQVKLRDAATFDNFLVADNRQLLELLQTGSESCVYFWSAEPAGKTHLLQAVCHASQASFYLPLEEWSALEPAILEGLEQFSIICLDDLHAIAGQPQWETQIFHLYNRVRDSGGHLYLTAKATPQQSGIQLADLVSRLGWGQVYQLHTLNDAQKIEALQMRSHKRGFDMPDDVAAYLLTHYPRDMHHLFALLEKLDEVSLQAQRRLTVPFVKKWL